MEGTSFSFHSISALTIDKDDNIYFANRAESIGQTIQFRKMNKQGIVTLLNSRSEGCDQGSEAPFTNNEPLGNTCIENWDLAVGPDGNVYSTARHIHKILKYSSSLPEFTAGELALPSEDGTQIFKFDATGRHIETRNALTGATIFTFNYDASGRLIQITDGDGDVTDFVRNTEGDLTKIVAEDGQETLIEYDANGYLNKVTLPETAEIYQMQYTAEGLMTQFTNPRGLSSDIIYNALGQMEKETEAAPDGGFLETIRTDDADGYEVSAKTELNRESIFRVETDVAGNTVRINTDPSGLVTTTTELTDDSVETVTPDGTMVTVTKTPDERFGMLAPLTSLNVDTPGGLSSEIIADRNVTLDGNNNVLTQIDTLTINNRPLTSTFDKNQLKVTNLSPEGRQTENAIDSQGRITKEIVPGFEDRNFTYDASGRLASISQGTGADERLTTFTYNLDGFLESINEPMSRTFSFEYDSNGRVTKQILPGSRDVVINYDLNGNVTSITPPGQLAHLFNYSSVDLEAGYSAPAVVGGGTNSTMVTYNFDKQPVLITRPDSQTISFNYDGGGRLQNTLIPRGTFTYNYSPLTGQLDQITAPDGGTLGFSYDGQLRLSSTWGGPSGSVSGSVSQIYNSDGLVTSRSVNGGNTISFQYDQDLLVTQAGDLTLQYSSNNNMLQGTTLGITNDSLTYNLFGEVSSYTADINSSTVFSMQFIRDKVGRIIKKTETVSGVTHVYDYAYDSADRLLSVSQDGLILNTYTYDLNGNRNNGIYDEQDRLTSMNGIDYTYTANGELLSRTEAGQTTDYDYDVFGNLLSVNLPGGTLIEYVYDGQNRRIGKKVSGTLERAWLYKDGFNPVAELDGSGNLVSRFVYGNRNNIPAYLIKNGTTYRIISDDLGSPRLVIDKDTGTIAQEMHYDEWGNVLTDTNPEFQPFGYAGGLYDPDTNLVQFGFRDYDPEVGRFTNKDPIRFAGQDTNLYGYVLNDPINFTDQLGLYGTNSCGFYDDICSRYGEGYCSLARPICKVTNKIEDLSEGGPFDPFDKPRNRFQCMRQCLQEKIENRLSRGICNVDQEDISGTGTEIITDHYDCHKGCLMNPENPFNPDGPDLPDRDPRLPPSPF